VLHWLLAAGSSVAERMVNSGQRVAAADVGLHQLDTNVIA
jgi:hypothetical protein